LSGSLSGTHNPAQRLMTGVEYAQGTGGRAGVRRQSDPGLRKPYPTRCAQRRTDCGRLPCRLRTLPATTPRPTTSTSSSTLPAWKTRQLITNSTVAASAIATRSANSCLPAPHNKCLRGRRRASRKRRVFAAEGLRHRNCNVHLDTWTGNVKLIRPRCRKLAGRADRQAPCGSRPQRPSHGPLGWPYPYAGDVPKRTNLSKKSSRSFTSTSPTARK
jgi:hypothetical protein